MVNRNINLFAHFSYHDSALQWIVFILQYYGNCFDDLVGSNLHIKL